MTVDGEPPPWSPARVSGSVGGSRSTGPVTKSTTFTTPVAPSNQVAGQAPRLEVDPPQLQTRVSVLLRLLFTLPVVVVVSLWGIVAVLAQVLGWFAALVTGRLPAWVWQLQTGHLRVAARAGGYLMMLTDLYPSYDQRPDPDYPIRLALSEPVRLNRAAVLFRVVLAIPALVLTVMAVTGWLLVSPVGWVCILRARRAPAAYWQACTAVLRWVLRDMAWASMVTSRYPRGLYGDRDQAHQSPTSTSSGGGTLRLSKAAHVVLSVFLVLGGVAMTYVGLARIPPAITVNDPAPSLQLQDPPQVPQPFRVIPPFRVPQTTPVLRPRQVLRPHQAPPRHQAPPVSAHPGQRVSTPVPTHSPVHADRGTPSHHSSHRTRN